MSTDIITTKNNFSDDESPSHLTYYDIVYWSTNIPSRVSFIYLKSHILTFRGYYNCLFYYLPFTKYLPLQLLHFDRTVNTYNLHLIFIVFLATLGFLDTHGFSALHMMIVPSSPTSGL